MQQPVKIRALGGAVIRELAPYEELVPLMASTLAAVSRGEAEMPLRMAMPVGEGRMIATMPGVLKPEAYAGVKLVSLNALAAAHGRSSHLGLMVLYETETLAPVALLDGSAVTALRTAATTVCATMALANPSARILTLLGAGEQADAHLEAFARVREFTQVRLWSRNPEAAERLAAKHTSSRSSIQAHSRLESAVAGADVVCTLTASPTPILPGRLIRPGVHVNLVGASSRHVTETDDDMVERARFFVDFRASALAQAGELLGAIDRGRVSAEHIAAELGEVIAGSKPGRTSSEDITVFKSLGISAEDIALSALVLRKAERLGLGQQFEI